MKIKMVCGAFLTQALPSPTQFGSVPWPRMSTSSPERKGPNTRQAAAGRWDEGLALLRHPSGSVLKTVGVQATDSWEMVDPDAGKHWLLQSAEAGDVHAMERLALHLLHGDGIVSSKDEGLSWLTQSAQLGNVVAMVRLAEWLLHEPSIEDSRAAAAQWYQRAIAAGYTSANISLGVRLITGRGLPADPRRGMELLHDAARRGSQLAHFRLAAHLIDGIGVPADREVGLTWLRRVGVTRAAQVADAGLHLYLQTLRKAAVGIDPLPRESAALFREALNQGHRNAGLNLAYLIRRGEIPVTGFSSLSELLDHGLSTGNAFAVANQALRLAGGVQCSCDWEAADALMGELHDPDPVMSWWLPRSREGDPEGQLVIAWLGRHGLSTDPEFADAGSRLELARQGGWSAPEWLAAPRIARRHSLSGNP